MMHSFSQRSFQAVLLLMGIGITWIGLDVGLGGLDTLGWQGREPFFQIVSEPGFLIQDSHQRFLGGLFGAIGLFCLWAAFRPQQYVGELRLIFGAIFIGGLARLSQQRLDVIYSQDIVFTAGFELILMPILLLWSRTIPESRQTL